MKSLGWQKYACNIEQVNGPDIKYHGIRTIPTQNQTFQDPNLLPEFLLLRGGQSQSCRIPCHAVSREPAKEDINLRCQISRKVHQRLEHVLILVLPALLHPTRAGFFRGKTQDKGFSPMMSQKTSTAGLAGMEELDNIAKVL